MRVLYASRGLGVHDERFLKALSKSSHEVFFLPLTPSVGTGLCLPEGIRQIHQPTEKMITPHSIGSLLERWNIELVHAGPVNDVARSIAYTGFRPLISMSWGFDLLWEAERDLLLWMSIKEALEQSTVFFCDAHTVESKAVEEYGFDSSRVVVFPWGVDHTLFYPTGTKSRRTDQDPLRIFSNRSWEDQYGVDVLVEGLIQAGKAGLAFEAVLAGDGSLKAALKEKIQNSPISHQVKFVGRISQAELPAYYNDAELYLSASHVDGSSLSLMEAMACGTTPLVSNIPSNLEWVTDDESGWLFEDGDAADLAAKLNMAKLNRSRITILGHNAQKKALEFADWEKNQQIMLSGYELAEKLHQEQDL